MKFLCRHHDTYRERDDKGVMTLKCERCHKPLGPVIQRSAKERKQAQRTGAVKEPKAYAVQPSKVARIR